MTQDPEAAQRELHKRSSKALRPTRAAALLLAGMAMGFAGAIALGTDLSWDTTPSRASDPQWEPRPGMVFDLSARADAHTEARTVAGLAVRSVSFIVDGQQLRCLRAMIP